MLKGLVAKHTIEQQNSCGTKEEHPLTCGAAQRKTRCQAPSFTKSSASIRIVPWHLRTGIPAGGGGQVSTGGEGGCAGCGRSGSTVELWEGYT